MNAVRVHPDSLRDLAERILAAVGVDASEARVIAACLVQANLRGVDSHGVARVIQYVETVRKGEVNPRPRTRVVRRDGALAVIDADGGYGFRPTLSAVDLAVEMARASGVGAVGVRNSHHFGMAALYSMRAAEAEMIGYITTTSLPVLAPHGGTRPLLGNNPISYAVPRRRSHPPIVLDMALSQAAFGKIRLAALEGRSIPLGWAYDSRGQPTTDAAAALASGLLVPIGDYKGYGLALISEVLAGVLTGSPFGAEANAHGNPRGGVGHLVIVLDIEHFRPRSQFYDDLERLIAQVKFAPLAESTDAIYLPGEPEWMTLQERTAHGIPLSAELWAKLRDLGQTLGVRVDPAGENLREDSV